MRVPARIPDGVRSASVCLLALAFLSSCTGDGSTLDPLGVPLGPPRATVTPSEIALSLVEGTSRNLTLQIGNQGGLPLRVTGVTSSSPFLVPAFPGPREVRAGDAWTVPVDVTAPAAAATPHGGVVRVSSNDPDHPVLEVTVALLSTAAPTPDIEVSPDSLWARLAPGGSNAYTVRIRNTGTGDLTVTDISSASPFVIPGITSAVVPPGDATDVVVTAVGTGLAVGEHLGTLDISSDDPDEPTISVPVRVRVESPFPATLSAIQDSVFTPHCALVGCHQLPVPQLDLLLHEKNASWAGLVGVNSQEVPALKRVDPGISSISYVIVKMMPAHPMRVGMTMPPSQFGVLPDSIVAVVRKWIDEGALQN